MNVSRWTAAREKSVREIQPERDRDGMCGRIYSEAIFLAYFTDIWCRQFGADKSGWRHLDDFTVGRGGARARGREGEGVKESSTFSPRSSRSTTGVRPIPIK